MPKRNSHQMPSRHLEAANFHFPTRYGQTIDSSRFGKYNPGLTMNTTCTHANTGLAAP